MVLTSITFATTLNFPCLQRFLLTLSSFTFSTFVKIHAGSIHPSDVLFTIPPLLLNLLVLFLEEFYKVFDINSERKSIRKEEIFSSIIICTVMVAVSRPFSLIVKTPFWMCISFSLIIQKDYLIDELIMNQQMVWYVVMVQFMNLYIAKGVGETLVGRRIGGFQSGLLRVIISVLLLLMNISVLLIVNKY